MDTGFSYRSKSTTVGRRRLRAATVLVVVLIVLDLISGGAVRGVVRAGVAGISSGFVHIASDIVGTGYFTSHSALEAQVQSLQAQVQSLQEQAALAQALSAQVTALSSVVHISSAPDSIAAPVASSFIASPYGTFLIGAGTSQGVAAGALVLAPGSQSEGAVVVGRVSSVGADTATVTELFAPNASTDALLDGASIVLSGRGGGNAAAQIPNGIAVNVGDAVTAPSLGGRIVGIVGHVDSDPSNAAMQVAVGSPVNLSSMQYVLVVRQ